MFERWRKCRLKIREDGPMSITGELMGIVRRQDLYTGDTLGIRDKRYISQYTVDALVVLLEFSRGKVIQVPFSWIEIIDETNEVN